jgi:hypothetical protein
MNKNKVTHVINTYSLQADFLAQEQIFLKNNLTASKRFCAAAKPY